MKQKDKQNSPKNVQPNASPLQSSAKRSLNSSIFKSNMNDSTMDSARLNSSRAQDSSQAVVDCLNIQNILDLSKQDREVLEMIKKYISE
jgi:hypothetical protein